MSEGKLPSHWGPDWQWFALRVEPQRELSIASKLSEGGFHARVPVRHVWFRRRPHDKRKALAARAQYVGYVFIGFGPGEVAPWKDITEVDGVLGVVGQGKTAVPVAEPGLISMLAGMRRPINYINKGKEKKRRNKDQRTAAILSGPYQGRTVRVIQIADDDPELYELFQQVAA